MGQTTRPTQEGSDKGAILSFTTHEGTFVPTWCIDGGSGVPVHKARSAEGQAQIAVSSELFRLFDWVKTVDALEQAVNSSDELLKGRSTKQLGVPLGRLSLLLVSPR